MTAGYSGTPLPQKLGIKEGHRVGLHRPPEDFTSTLGAVPPGVSLVSASSAREHDVLLFFVRNHASLRRDLTKMKAKMAPTTSLWVCWPKKSSPLASDVDEGAVRTAGLDAGLVDVKICAVDEDWSGLKFVYRLKDRPAKKK